ncbi:MarR family winged helix-turn-helix transcriptional regulator [Acanthopleuribacter pedis]|uniref:Winged helix DNA-binding protein n=1 Tax=Acanthopleuribacter pedis TaxID=442870 RepID=A0A8J7Q1R9_9BACT|nr:MarR family transcriptional regulator [Acanthopleuribacter pedis]MBO1317670.1 winged helix DNA-binding protein [Acanthopleuribacter pedis]
MTEKSGEFLNDLNAAKQANVLERLFRCARLLNDEGTRRVADLAETPILRAAHMNLMPHIDLAGTRLTVLAQRLGVTKQAASQLVADLEKMGVLKREPDPDDGRAKRVVFTEQGRQGLLEGLAVLRQMEEELRMDIGDKEIDRFNRTLGTILGWIQTNSAKKDT